MVIELLEVKEKTVNEPKFINPSELTEEQLTDPDYSLKQIAKLAGVSKQQILICSKCHHCR